MKKVYLLIIFIALVSINAMSCKNIKQEQLVVESQKKDSTINNYNQEEVANTIFIIPEVVSLKNSIRNATNGKRGASILYDDIDNESKEFLVLKVGDNNEIRFQTYYRFLVDKKTNDIYAIWNDEKLYPLGEWSKINSIQKEYNSYSDSIKYIDYLSKHYLNISKEIEDQVAKTIDYTNLKVIDLPLCLNDMLEVLFNKTSDYDSLYPHEAAPNMLIEDLLKKSDIYIGESYQVYHIYTKSFFDILLLETTRGDSTYYDIISVNNYKIVHIVRVGSIGDEDPIYFCIDENLLISTLDSSKKILNQYETDDNYVFHLKKIKD